MRTPPAAIDLLAGAGARWAPPGAEARDDTAARLATPAVAPRHDAGPILGPEMHLAVQIVNYQTAAYLERCVASVVADLRDSGLDYEINLLDNASGDDLRPLAARHARCQVHVAERNLGFGAGHNLLAAKTGADYVLILNPDIEFIIPDTAAQLLESAQRPRVKVVGPKLVSEDGTAQRWDHGRLHGLRAQISYRAGHSYWRPSVRREDVAWVSGAAMLVEHDMYRSVGGFDEAFFLYKEDEDLCLRIRQAGGLISYEPRISIRHRGSVIAGRGDHLATSTDHFIEKHFAHRLSRRVFAALHRRLPYLRL
jgi:N-acetylglucosaminyl-diphospho-decaprenol L-rhamnosyltransferase